MAEYVKFYFAIHVPIETYRRLEGYAKRVGVNISEAFHQLFKQFFREIPISVLDSIMELEGISENQVDIERMMEVIFKCFNHWFDEKYGKEA